MASKKPDATLLVLREIRDELKKTNAEVKRTNERIDNIERQLPGLLSDMEDRLTTTIETWLNRLPVVDMAWRQGVDTRLRELEKKTG